MTILMYIYLTYSKHGYEIAVVGESQRTASYAGIKVERVIIRTMVLSGAVCGLMGLLLTAGTDHTLTTTIVGGRGLHGCHGLVAGEVQSHRHGLHEPASRRPQPRRRAKFPACSPSTIPSPTF